MFLTRHDLRPNTIVNIGGLFDMPSLSNFEK
jgi:hypothetical protein